MRLKKFFGASALALVFMFTMCVFTACGARVESLTLDTSKVTTELDYNQDLDLSGLVVTANYAKESKVLKKGDYAVDKGGFNKAVAGSYTITISFGNKSADFSVRVNPNIQDAIGLELKTEIAKKVYDFGQNYSSFGLGVYAVFAGDVKYKLSDSQFTIDSSNYDPNIAGTYTIVVTLNNVLHNGNPITASYEVTVNPAPVTLKSLRVDTTNAKTEFEWGEQFTSSGLKVYKVFSDGSEELVNSVSVDARSFKSTVAGTYSIIVSVSNGAVPMFESYSVVVKVRPSATITNIDLDLTTNNVKTTFEYGDSFTSSGLIVNKVMSYGDPEVALPSEYSVNSSAFNSRVAGTYTIVVTSIEDETKTVSYDVTVNAPVQNGISLDVDNVKLNYYLGEALEIDNLMVYKTYANTTVTDLMTDDEYDVDASAFDNTNGGTYTITVTQKDSTFSTTFEVSVQNSVKVLGLQVSNAKTNFEWGEPFDAGSIVVKKVVSYGEPITLESSEYTINSSAYNANTAGTYRIVVSLNGTFIVTNYDVTVGERPAPVVVGITLNTENAKTVFAWGEDFDATGLVVLKQMDYGDPVVAEESEYTVNYSAYDSRTADNYTITVALNGTEYSVDYTVTVSAPTPVLQGWILNTDYVKTTFAWGETFNSDNLTVSKEYNVGNEDADPSEYTIDSSEYKATTAGTYTIYVVCSDGTRLPYDVTVRSITYEQMTAYCVFKDIEITTPSGVIHKLPHQTEIMTYTFVTFETGTFTINVTTNNEFVTVENFQNTVRHTDNSSVTFGLTVDNNTHYFYVEINQNSPIQNISIDNNSISLNKETNTYLIENDTLNNPVNLEVQWSVTEGYAWKLNGEIQSLNLINMSFENNTTYTVEIISNATGVEFVLQTLYIKVVPADIVDSILVEWIENENSNTMYLDKVDVDKYYFQSFYYIGDFNFVVNYTGEAVYTTNVRKEVANIVRGDNVYFIDIMNGSDLVKTITVTYNCQYDINLDNSKYFNTNYSDNEVYTETYSKTLNMTEYSFYNSNNELVTVLSVGENNLVGRFTRDGNDYEFNIIINVMNLPISSVFVDNVEYSIEDNNTEFVIRKGWFETAIFRAEYQEGEVSIHGVKYQSGTEYKVNIGPDTNQVDIYVNGNVYQNIRILFLESSFITKVSVTDKKGVNVINEREDGYYYETDLYFKGVDVTVQDGYTYELLVGDNKLSNELKLGYNFITINVYDVDHAIVETKQFKLNIRANITITQEDNMNYATQHYETNSFSLTDADISKKFSFVDDVIATMNGNVIDSKQITLTDNVNKITFTLSENGVTYTADLYICKAGVLSANDLFRNITVYSNDYSDSVDLRGIPCNVGIAINAVLDECEVEVEFEGAYSNYTNQVNIVNGNFVVTVYDNENNKVTDVVIVPIRKGVVNNDVRAYYQTISVLGIEDGFIEDGSVLNVSTSTLMNFDTYNDFAVISYSGLKYVDIMGVRMIVFEELGSFDAVVSVCATDGTQATYNITVVVGETQYAFEVDYAGQHKSFGGLERNNDSFVQQSESSYVGYFDLDMNAIDTENQTIALEFTINDLFSIVCGDIAINNGVNNLPYTLQDGVYTVSITTNIDGEDFTFVMLFTTSTTLATFNINGETRTLKMYADGNVGAVFIPQDESTLITVYKEDYIIKTTTADGVSYHVNMSITNLAEGYTVIDSNTGSAISDLSNITIALQQQDMSGISMYMGMLVAVDANENQFVIMFMFSDLMYLMQSIM